MAWTTRACCTACRAGPRPIFSAPRHRSRRWRSSSSPPRTAGRIEYDYHDTAQQQKILAGVFEGVGWHVPDLLGQMPAAADFYFDSVSQVRLDRWSSGRVALIGDAGYAAGPGGNGTGTAVVAAYVLAGELAAARGDYRAALRPLRAACSAAYVARGQKQARGGAGLPRPGRPRRRSGSATGSSGCCPTCRRPGAWSGTCPPGPRPPSSCPSTSRTVTGGGSGRSHRSARCGPCGSPAPRPRTGPSRRQRSRACGRTPAREG